MTTILKKVISYVLIAIVLFFTVIALLDTWEILDLQEVGRKFITSLLIIFAASAVILFIFSVLIKDNEHNKFQNNQMG
jgi:predicted acyltransferase